jgi:hypothetical protein
VEQTASNGIASVAVEKRMVRDSVSGKAVPAAVEKQGTAEIADYQRSQPFSLDHQHIASLVGIAVVLFGIGAVPAIPFDLSQLRDYR